LSEEKSEKVHFSHPAEEMFAQILDYYGIIWTYEPRTFILETDGAGNTTLAFTPDFYLVEQDLYIELTTLRPQLSTIKNKKMRLMAERFPEIKIKLMKRREMRDLMIKFGLFHKAAQISTPEERQQDLDHE
jgi:hypoxanthine phosphoribosyltransferase